MTWGWVHKFPVLKDVFTKPIDYPDEGWDTQIADWYEDIFDAVGNIEDALGYDIRGGYADLKTWLDAIVANVVSKNLKDRGDPAASDYTQATLTLDGNWNDLDLSGFGSAGITLFMLFVDIKDTAADFQLWFRKKGNTNDINIDAVTAPVANVHGIETLYVFCDVNRKIQYKSFLGTAPVVDLAVRGWQF